MHSTFYKTTALLSALTLSLSLILPGCSSSGESLPIPDINATHGMKDDSGATYGSGPNHTRPYPQSEEVNLNGVPGVTPKYEPLSRGGNKDYRVLGKDYEVWKNCSSYLEVGTASWYGPGFHGNKTSNGEVYNQKGYSAAHKNLPLPSYLKVTNLENGKAVVVRVNDRGPFHGSRIIDLSEGAARAIDMTAKGTAKVKLEYINSRYVLHMEEVNCDYYRFKALMEEFARSDSVSERVRIMRNVLRIYKGDLGSEMNYPDFVRERNSVRHDLIFGLIKLVRALIKDDERTDAREFLSALKIIDNTSAYESLAQEIEKQLE